MYNIVFNKVVYKKIDRYTEIYRKYFEEFYQDSWIWEEEKIINNYIIESEDRYFQILEEIKNKLSDPIITYMENKAIISWRSKILLVSFKDIDNTRIITDLDIR